MIVVIAKFLFVDGKMEEVKEILKELVEKTNQEAGCIEYKPYQSNENNLEVVMIEKWESQAHLDAHAKTTHFVELVGKLGDYNQKAPEIITYKNLY